MIIISNSSPTESPILQERDFNQTHINIINLSYTLKSLNLFFLIYLIFPFPSHFFLLQLPSFPSFLISPSLNSTLITVPSSQSLVLNLSQNIISLVYFIFILYLSLPVSVSVFFCLHLCMFHCLSPLTSISPTTTSTKSPTLSSLSFTLSLFSSLSPLAYTSGNSQHKHRHTVIHQSVVNFIFHLFSCFLSMSISEDYHSFFEHYVICEHPFIRYLIRSTCVVVCMS